MALLLTVGAIAPSMFSLSLTNAASSSRLSSFNSQFFVGDRPLYVPSRSPISLATGATSSLRAVPLVICGRGDRKTLRGKRFNHSFGNARPRNKKKGTGPPQMPTPPALHKKDDVDDEVFSDFELEEDPFDWRTEEYRFDGQNEDEGDRVDGQIEDEEDRVDGQIEDEEDRVDGQIEDEEDRVDGQIEDEEDPFDMPEEDTAFTSPL